MDDSHILFNIPDANSVNHVVVFLTGQQPLAEGMGAAGNILQHITVLHLLYTCITILILQYIYYLHHTFVVLQCISVGQILQLLAGSSLDQFPI